MLGVDRAEAQHRQAQANETRLRRQVLAAATNGTAPDPKLLAAFAQAQRQTKSTWLTVQVAWNTHEASTAFLGGVRAFTASSSTLLSHDMTAFRSTRSSRTTTAARRRAGATSPAADGEGEPPPPPKPRYWPAPQPDDRHPEAAPQVALSVLQDVLARVVTCREWFADGDHGGAERLLEDIEHDLAGIIGRNSWRRAA